ncbi:MAG: tRNA lysidine(34) synthetase TilS [Rikenellaceae bacterium]
MQLINRFKNELHKTQLFDFTDKILIGVSGGRDSMCLTHILHTCGYNISIAHCNFSLRGDESDTDEEHVRNYALENGIPLHTVRFNTIQEAQDNGESIQIAARRLRYNWFNELSKKYKYNYVAIAHNSDDCAETFFINLTRGTGIKGLRGIQQKRDNIVRPLIFATRAEITDFCNEQSIAYRDDSSNSSNKYLRNKIRHKIMPVFKELNNDFNSTMLATTENVSQSYELLQFFISELKKKAISMCDNQVTIDLSEIKLTPTPSYSLFEIIREWGFAYKQCEGIICADAEQKSGLQFFSKDYVLLLNRGKLILNEVNSSNCGVNPEDALIIDKFKDSKFKDLKFNNCKIKLDVLDVNDIESFKTPSNMALFDLDSITPPLTVRTFVNGDEFAPFGMQGTKKVSDFMIDSKLSALDKEKVLIFESNNQIMWVAPYRTSNIFRITKKTKDVLRITLDK